jgi:hypothetical protein
MYLIVLKLFVLLYAVGLDASVPESIENMPSYALQHFVLGLVGHEFSFAEYDEYEKR